MKNIIFILILCAVLKCTTTNAQARDSLAVVQAAEKFVKAFTSFDWATFRNCFSKDATIFFPAELIERRNGQQEIEKAWVELFPEFIDPTKKLDLKINPQSMRIQFYGNMAIVTFHLGEQTERLSRRTLVFVKEEDAWKIVHLHASSLKKEK